MSKRSVTSFHRGFGTAAAMMAGGAIAVTMLLAGLDASFRLDNDALSDIAQIGATLLVAYAVETSWLVKTSKKRGPDRESWIGFVVGVGVCSAFAIAFAVALLDGHGPASFVQTVMAMWMLFSLGLLILIVAGLPLFAYEWAHDVNSE